MKIVSRVFVFFLAVIFLPSIAVAQDKPTVPINTAVENVQNYFSVYPVEKLHLHFDKPYYAVGDTLWFKTYLNVNLFNYEASKVALC